MFLFMSGIRADDGLALLDLQDLHFSDVLCFLNQLSVRKAFWYIVQAVKVTQSLSPCLYLTRAVPFSSIMRIVREPSVLSVTNSSVVTQGGIRTVTFDASV